MEKEVKIEFDKLEEKFDELLDKVNLIASELVLADEEKIEKIEEDELYKLLNNDFIEFKENCENLITNLNKQSLILLYQNFCDKYEFLVGDVSMAEALSGENIDEKLFKYNYIKLDFCIREIDLILENIEKVKIFLSKLK
ncbi:MAG: hypothetical protein E7359_02415 [Clostridiales bacterium]|nr:hypothetical protein [Clostridiales bacterium]